MTESQSQQRLKTAQRKVKPLEGERNSHHVQKSQQSEKYKSLITSVSKERADISRILLRLQDEKY